MYIYRDARLMREIPAIDFRCKLHGGGGATDSLSEIEPLINFNGNGGGELSAL